MTKTEVRRLRVGSKFLYHSPLGYTTKRRIQFIAWSCHNPFIVFYGSGYGQRLTYEQLLLERYVLLER